MALHGAIHRMIDPHATSTLIQFAHDVAIAHNLNADHFLGTLKCESGWNYLICGDHGNSCGIAQISKIYHPEVTKEMSQNPYFSILWMARKWQEGKASMWSCYKILYG